MTLTPTKIRQLARRYGLSQEDFLTLIEWCHNRCPLCTKPFTNVRLPVVDHQHQLPMRTRGVLCAPCNWLLGTRSEDPHYYRRIADYLESPPAYRLPGPPRRPQNAPPLQ